MFYLGYHPSGRLPTRGLVQKALVLDLRFLAGPAHRTFQQLLDVPLQVFVGRYADGVLHAPLLQRFVNPRLGKGRVGPKRARSPHLKAPTGENRLKIPPKNHRPKALPNLLQAREKAKADIEAAQEVLQKAKEAYARAHGDVHNARVRADMRRTEQEKILRDSYPREIDKFKDEMDELLRLTRSKGSESRDHG